MIFNEIMGGGVKGSLFLWGVIIFSYKVRLVAENLNNKISIN